jgi:dTDP-4-dehydrorhamnose reductase
MTEQPRILIVGAAGQVGVELQRSFAGFGSVVAVDLESVDLANEEQTRALVRRIRPDVILNAAAYTAVDRAESQRDLAMAINATAPRVLAEEALPLNALLVHYSTDYVFNGEKEQPWVESDEPNPLNMYGISKLAGEQAIQQVGGRFPDFSHQLGLWSAWQQLFLTMLRLGRERDRLSIVDDQFGGPTTSIELANATRTITEGVLPDDLDGPGLGWTLPHDLRGLNDVVRVCEGHLRRCGCAAQREATRTHEPQATKDYPTPAKRPRNSVLSNEKLYDRFGVRLASWQTALDDVFEALSSAGDSSAHSRETDYDQAEVAKPQPIRAGFTTHPGDSGEAAILLRATRIPQSRSWTIAPKQ